MVLFLLFGEGVSILLSGYVREKVSVGRFLLFSFRMKMKRNVSMKKRKQEKPNGW